MPPGPADDTKRAPVLSEPGHFALAFAGIASVFLMGLLETFHLPDAVHERVGLTARIAGFLVGGALVCAGGQLLSLAGLGVVSARSRGTPKRAVAALLVVLAGWLAPWAWIGRSYHLPAQALFVGSACCVAPVLATCLRAGSWPSRGLSLAALVGFAVLHVVNHTAFVRLYAAVHLVFFQGSLLLLAVALAEPVDGLRRRVGTRATGLTFAAAFMLAFGLGRSAGAEAKASTLLGRALVVRRATTVVERSVRTIGDDPDAERTFAKHSGLPPLPEQFALSDHDVLLITVESMRFDATSLAGGADTTPHLRRLAAESLSFTNAHSPSTGTLASMSAIHTMKPPSTVDFEIWQKSWLGQLSPKETTVAELFSAGGRGTFWAGHNFRGAFHIDILGLEQGFEQVIHEGTEPNGMDVDLDRRIAQKAGDTIAAFTATKRSYFGWVFFASPHSPYQVRYAQRSTGTAHDRYLHEIEWTDESLGALLSPLRKSARWDRTVVIVTSDHGEEFGEHGGSHHKNSAYTELSHVPLVIRIPGMPSKTSSAPVSVHHVLPWLLLRGDAREAAAAQERLTRDIGPLMRETGGATLVELLGRERMESALIFSDHCVYLDLLADHLSAFDLQRDPAEQQDVWLEDDSRFPKSRGAAEGYRSWRASRRRYQLDATRVAPE